MEKTRQIKMLSIVALVVAITGMTLGFAAFSTTLSISSSAIVTPNSHDFKIVVSSSSSDTTATNFVPTIVGDATLESFVIDQNTEPKVLDFSVGFTKPGEKVSVKMYAHNVGKYDAYFKSVTFNNVSGTDLKKVCSIPEGSGASESLVNQACEEIEMYVNVALGGSYVDVKETTSYSEMVLLVGNFGVCNVIINYPEDAPYVDGPFNITFGDVEFSYSTTD